MTTRHVPLVAIGFVLSFACYAGLALFYVWLVQLLSRNRIEQRAKSRPCLTIDPAHSSPP